MLLESSDDELNNYYYQHRHRSHRHESLYGNVNDSRTTWMNSNGSGHHHNRLSGYRSSISSSRLGIDAGPIGGLYGDVGRIGNDDTSNNVRGYFHHVTPSRGSHGRSSHGFHGIADFHHDNRKHHSFSNYSSNFATLRRNHNKLTGLPSSVVAPGYLPPLVTSYGVSPGRQTMYGHTTRRRTLAQNQTPLGHHLYQPLHPFHHHHPLSTASSSTTASSSHRHHTPSRTQTNQITQTSKQQPLNSNSSSSTCSSDSTSQVVVSSGSTPSPPRGYLSQLPPPPPPNKPPPLPPPNLPPRPVGGFANYTKSCQSIPSTMNNYSISSDKYYYQKISGDPNGHYNNSNSQGKSTKSQLSLLVSPTHHHNNVNIEPVYTNKHYMSSTHSLGNQLGINGNSSNNTPGHFYVIVSTSAISIPSSLSQIPLAPGGDDDDDDNGEDGEDIIDVETGAKIRSSSLHKSPHRHMPNHNGSSGHNSNGTRSRHSSSSHRRHRSRSKDRSSNEISCTIKYVLFGCNMIAWVIGFLIMAAGFWAWNEKDYLSNLFNIPLLTLDPAFGLIVIGTISFVIGFVGCIGALRENTCLLATYSIFLATLLIIELGLSILAFVMKDWIRSQATSGMQAFIVYYRDDPDRQNLIDWIQESWLECCGIEGPKDWDMNIYFNCSSVAQGSKEACGVPFSCCRSDTSTNIYDDSIILKNKQCGYDVRKPDFSRDRSSIISEKGCLRAAEEWIEGNFLLISFLTLAIAAVQKPHIRSVIMTKGCMKALEEWFQRNLLLIIFVYLLINFVEILGICFSQNLRTDIQTQRSKWR